LLLHPAYSPDLALCDYFPVSKPEEMVRRKEIHHQRVHCRNRGLFEGLDKSLFGRLEKVGELDQVYRLKGDYLEK